MDYFYSSYMKIISYILFKCFVTPLGDPTVTDQYLCTFLRVRGGLASSQCCPSPHLNDSGSVPSRSSW